MTFSLIARHLRRLGHRLGGECSGATLMEYALMAALIGIVVIGVIVSGHGPK